MKNLAGLQLIAALYIMADLLKIVNQVIIFCEESFDTLSGVFYVGYLAFQGLAIWIFCFNYFALSWKISEFKIKNHEDLEMRLAFLYYFLCGYNVLAPIIAGSCPFDYWPSFLFYLQTYCCWAVSVFFLANAMKRIHDTLKCETKTLLNVRAMRIQLAAFLLYVVYSAFSICMFGVMEAEVISNSLDFYEKVQLEILISVGTILSALCQF